MAPITHNPHGSLREEASPVLLEPYADALDIPSPVNSLSDKENHAVSNHPLRSEKRKRPGETMAPSSVPKTPPNSSVNKRQRLAESSLNIGSQSQTRGPQRGCDNPYYDPDQDENERRRIRKEFRDLTRELHDYRSEFLQAGNRGIVNTLHKANELFVHVKQTSDATVDSRLLVNAADLSYKKTTQLALGDATAGIDLDQFVSKCISFMRQGSGGVAPAPLNGTQRCRQRASGRVQRDDENSDEDEDDALNWDWLGRAACFSHNSRPPVPGFLLGPLSVQKRIRQQTQRRVRERIDPSKAVRPQELKEDDLDKQETSNLTVLCTNINKLLMKTQREAQNKVDDELSSIDDEITEGVVQEVMDRHNVADDGGIPLFRFCINPKSFGQSVENLFYVSFLVRDGSVGVSMDSRGLPTLQAAKPYAPNEAQRRGIQKHQAVFSLDFETWHHLIDVFRIVESIIPHRQEEEQMGTGRARGWYS